MLNKNIIYNEDCLKALKKLSDNSIDSVITDPPYELGFMNKSWDATGIAYNVDFWKEVYRVLKPGGYLASFGGTRTYHRMACAIEDAGFEIRDQLQWLYGSGFPKSMDISKQLDKKAGVEREIVSTKVTKSGGMAHIMKTNVEQGYRPDDYYAEKGNVINETKPTSPEAQQWEGWGTALKPSNEPIVLARKPLSEKTVADNILKWGTGGINIDDCRVEANGEELGRNNTGMNGSILSPKDGWNNNSMIGLDLRGRSLGRFPANLLLSHSIDCTNEECSEDCPIKNLDEQSGNRPSGKSNGNAQVGEESNGAIKPLRRGNLTPRNDEGGASRFFNHCDWDINDLQASFMYCAKANKKDRGEENNHPTVKPKSLMKWLITLLTPPNGIILDPFAGSGTTGIAAKELGFDCILIEKEEEYIPIIEHRTEFSIFMN